MPPFLRLLPLPRQLTTDPPKPVAAYVGFLLSLPRIAVDLPGQAVSAGVALAARYEELAELGSAVLGGRGAGPEDEDDEEPLPSYATMDTSAWGAADTDAEIVRLFEADGAESLAEALVATEQAPVDDTSAEEAAADATLDAITTDPPATAVTTPGPPVDAGPMPAATRPDTGSAAEFLAAASEDRAGPPGAVPDRADLPIEGYDGLSAAALRSRLSGLTSADLTVLRNYEAAHAKRLTVLSSLERAIAKA